MIGYTPLVIVVVLLVETVRSFPKSVDFQEWKDLLLNDNETISEWNDSVPIDTYPKNDIVDHVNFYLYTQKTRSTPLQSKITDRKLFDGQIDITKPVKILIHGYMSSRNQLFAKTIREAYLDKGDFNIINVDWAKDAHTIYTTARKDVPAVGKVVATFIDKLVNETGLKVEILHVLGHSLGAHIAGVAGLNVKSGLIMRITGLDPAGPLFSYDDKERLKPSSAGFVDVIHTCGKGLGFYGDLGHADFYPNHGTAAQPGCSISMGKCSHTRAVLLYAESLTTPNGFLGTKCDHWSEFTGGKCKNNPTAFMGEYISLDAQGKYWLRTSSSPPYALGPDAESQKRIAGPSILQRISTAALQSLAGGGLG